MSWLTRFVAMFGVALLIVLVAGSPWFLAGWVYERYGSAAAFGVAMVWFAFVGSAFCATVDHLEQRSKP